MCTLRRRQWSRRPGSAGTQSGGAWSSGQVETVPLETTGFAPDGPDSDAEDPFERAPHVSGVAGRHAPTKARRVVAETLQLIAEREQFLRRLGIDSTAEFRRRRNAGKLRACGPRTCSW